MEHMLINDQPAVWGSSWGQSVDLSCQLRERKRQVTCDWGLRNCYDLVDYTVSKIGVRQSVSESVATDEPLVLGLNTIASNGYERRVDLAIVEKVLICFEDERLNIFQDGLSSSGLGPITREDCGEVLGRFAKQALMYPELYFRGANQNAEWTSV